MARNQRGMNPNSQNNLINPHDKLDGEFFKEAQKKGVENRRKRKKFKEIFENVLTDKKQKIIASDFVDMLLDRTMSVNNRCRILELILKILGEDGNLSANDLNELTQHIELKIE